MRKHPYIMPVNSSHLVHQIVIIALVFPQCSAEKFHNWGQCPRALENVGTFEKKAGTLCEK